MQTVTEVIDHLNKEIVRNRVQGEMLQALLYQIGPQVETTAPQPQFLGLSAESPIPKPAPKAAPERPARPVAPKRAGKGKYSGRRDMDVVLKVVDAILSVKEPFSRSWLDLAFGFDSSKILPYLKKLGLLTATGVTSDRKWVKVPGFDSILPQHFAKYGPVRDVPYEDKKRALGVDIRKSDVD
jgi:hypothetical protein